MPAVVLVHEPFVTLAKAQFQALGAKDPTMLVYKQDAPHSSPRRKSPTRRAGWRGRKLVSRIPD